MLKQTGYSREAPLLPAILRFSIPLMLTGILQLAYNTADSIIVGRYAGHASLAAVGSTTSIIFLIITLFNGVSIGANYMAARDFGAQDDRGLFRTVHCAALLSVILGLLACVCGLLLSTPLLRWADAPEDVLPLSVLYLRIYFLGVPALVVYNFGSALLRAVGDTFYPLLFMIVSGALNVALNVAKSTDKTVAFFSLEMSREQLATRLLSNESFVDNQKLTTGKLDEEDWGKLSLASSALSQTDIRVDDNPAITVAEMNAKCRRLDNLGLVVIDYLQLMTAAAPGKSGENRVTVVSEISRALKIMAKELNVPVICLSQLSRANESRTDKRPMLSDLRESGAIEQDADSVMFIYRDDYYNENSEGKNIAECIVAKNRHGETGTVKLQWLPQFTTFSNLEWKHEG